MNQYVTGAVIKELREKSNMTQLQLADRLGASDKTIAITTVSTRLLCEKSYRTNRSSYKQEDTLFPDYNEIIKEGRNRIWSGLAR